MATINEVKTLIEALAAQVKEIDSKLDQHSLADAAMSVAANNRQAAIDQLKSDVYGDGNGKKGIRREMDDVQRVVDQWKRITAIASGAAITSAVATLMALIFRV